MRTFHAGHCTSSSCEGRAGIIRDTMAGDAVLRVLSRAQREWSRHLPQLILPLWVSPGLLWLARNDALGSQLFTRTFERNERAFVSQIRPSGNGCRRRWRQCGPLHRHRGQARRCVRAGDRVRAVAPRARTAAVPSPPEPVCECDHRGGGVGRRQWPGRSADRRRTRNRLQQLSSGGSGHRGNPASECGDSNARRLLPAGAAFARGFHQDGY